MCDLHVFPRTAAVCDNAATAGNANVVVGEFSSPTTNSSASSNRAGSVFHPDNSIFIPSF